MKLKQGARIQNPRNREMGSGGGESGIQDTRLRMPNTHRCEPTRDQVYMGILAGNL